MATNWLGIVQTATQLLPLVGSLVAPNDPTVAKIAGIASEAATSAQVVIAGFQPPRDLASVEADFDLIVQNLPPEVAEDAAVASVLKGYQNTAATLADLTNGQAVVLFNYQNPALPPTSPKCVTVTMLEGGAAYDAIFGSQ